MQGWPRTTPLPSPPDNDDGDDDVDDDDDDFDDDEDVEVTKKGDIGFELSFHVVRRKYIIFLT